MEKTSSYQKNPKIFSNSFRHSQNSLRTSYVESYARLSQRVSDYNLFTYLVTIIVTSFLSLSLKISEISLKKQILETRKKV